MMVMCNGGWLLRWVYWPEKKNSKLLWLAKDAGHFTDVVDWVQSSPAENGADGMMH